MKDLQKQTIGQNRSKFSRNQQSLQSSKQSAFYDYLRSFCENGIQTLTILQKQFNKLNSNTNKQNNQDLQQFQRSSHKSRQQINKNNKYAKINTLISSYEIFIFEINDSCMFVELPEFGQLILQVFGQLNNVLKWTIKQNLQYMTTINQISNRLVRTKLSQSTNWQAFRSTMMNKTQNQNVLDLAGQIVKTMTDERKSKKNRPSLSNKRINPSIIFKKKNQAILPQQIPYSIQSSEACQQCKKRTTFNVNKMKIQLSEMSSQINNIQSQFVEQEIQIQKQQQAQYKKLKNFIQKRQQKNNLQTILNSQLSGSRNEQILNQIMYTLTRKGQAIQRFAQIKSLSLKESIKAQQATQQDFQAFKNYQARYVGTKVQQAKHRLYILFKQHLSQYQQLKKNSMKDDHTNVTEQQLQQWIRQTQGISLIKQNDKLMMKRQKRLIQKLQAQIICEKNNIQNLMKMIQQKNHQNQTQMSKYRNQIIRLSCKIKPQMHKSSRRLNHSTLNNHQIIQLQSGILQQIPNRMIKQQITNRILKQQNTNKMIKQQITQRKLNQNIFKQRKITKNTKIQNIFIQSQQNDDDNVSIDMNDQLNSLTQKQNNNFLKSKVSNNLSLNKVGQKRQSNQKVKFTKFQLLDVDDKYSKLKICQQLKINIACQTKGQDHLIQTLSQYNNKIDKVVQTQFQHYKTIDEQIFSHINQRSQERDNKNQFLTKQQFKKQISVNNLDKNKHKIMFDQINKSSIKNLLKSNNLLQRNITKKSYRKIDTQIDVFNQHQRILKNKTLCQKILKRIQRQSPNNRLNASQIYLKKTKFLRSVHLQKSTQNKSMQKQKNIQFTSLGLPQKCQLLNKNNFRKNTTHNKSMIQNKIGSFIVDDVTIDN